MSRSLFTSKKVLLLAAILLVLPFAFAQDAQSNDDRVEVLIGAVTIEPLDDFTLAVTFDDRERTGLADGVAERLFLLQMDDPAPNLGTAFEKARVAFRPDGVIITSLGETPETFGMFVRSDEPGKPLADRQVDRMIAELRQVRRDRDGGFFSGLTSFFDREEPMVQAYTGYGLIEQHGSFQLPLALADLGGHSAPESTQDGGLDSLFAAQITCVAGGPGASSCGISGCNDRGCSVSCGSGYFACCFCDGNPGCICVQSGGGGGGGGGCLA